MTDEPWHLKELRKAALHIRNWTERRDQLIRDARAEGLPLRTVAEAAGLSHTAIAKIEQR